MRNPLYTLAILVLLLSTTGGLLLAQAPTPQRAAYRIEGITSAERDAIAADLARAGEFRIAFACVPAGILVIEPLAATSGLVPSSARAMAALREQTHGRVIQNETRSQDELESVCMSTRDQ